MSQAVRNMESFGSDMYLPQEGCPSIDFTLLDRPSSSIVPAREVATQFPQEDTSFQSFDFFDGAGVESLNNQSFAAHRSYVLDAQNEALRRHTSEKQSVNSSQRHGVHDFFDQENQCEKSGSGTWPSHEQSSYFLSGPSSVEESFQETAYGSSNYESSHNYNSERLSPAVRMIHPPMGFTKPLVGEARNHTQLLNVSSTMQNDVRIPSMSSQRVLSHLQSNHLRSNSFMASYKGIPRDSSVDNLGSFEAQYHNQIDKCDVPNQAGATYNVVSYDSLGNQAPWRRPRQPPQAVAGQQFQCSSRTAGMGDVQSQQLQEMFTLHHLKQSEDSRKQEMLLQAQNQFSGTSYSDLLHGPDTPPFQNQAVEEIVTEDHEKEESLLPPQNVQMSQWSAHGPAHGSQIYQGFVSDVDMGQNQSSTSQISLFGETLDYNRHQNGPVRSSFSEGRNAVPLYLGGDRTSCSRQETRKPVLQPGSAGSEHLGEFQVTNFGFGNDGNELRRTGQKMTAVQSSQYPVDSFVGQQMRGGNSSHVDVFSQSQQHFQGLQLNGQRSCSFEQKQSFPTQRLGFLPESNLKLQKSTSKFRIQQSPNNMSSTGSAVGYSPYKLDSSFDFDNSCEQPQWSTASSLSVPAHRSNANMGVDSQHQSILWDSMLAAQSQKGPDCYQQLISNTQYSSLSNSSSQQPLQHGFFELGVPPSSVKDSSVRQQESYNTPSNLMNARASSPNNGFSSSQRSMVKASPSDCPFQHLSEPYSHLQGAWKKCNPPSQFPAGICTLDGFKPIYGFQGQSRVNSQPSSRPMITSKDPNNASLHYDSHQQACKELFSAKDDSQLERCITEDLRSGVSTADLMKTSSTQTLKVVPEVMEEAQHLFCESAKPKKEVSEQQVDPCMASISLAHLKGNQSSNPLSPQHVKLGLGPSSMSQDFQKVNETSWRSLGQIPSLEKERPISRSAHETFHTGLPHVNSVSEIKRKNGFEGSTATIDSAVLQSNATRPLVSSCRSSPTSKEMDDSPPSSFAFGQEMGPGAVLSAKTTLFNPGCQPSQSKYGVARNAPSSVSQVQTTTLEHTGCQDSLMNGYSRKLSYSSNYSIQPNNNAAAMLLHNQLLNDNLRWSDYDSGVNAQQNHQSSNMALKQLGNRAQTVNLVGSDTTLKTSLLEQSKPMGTHGQVFSGIVESSILQPSSAQGLGGGTQRDTRCPMENTQMMLNFSTKQGDKRHLVQNSAAHRQRTPDECHSQSDASKGQASGIEASGLMSNTAPPNLQEEKTFLGSSLKCSLSSSSEIKGPSQDQNKYQHAKPLNVFTLETDAVVQSCSRPPLQGPSSFNQEGFVQHMKEDGNEGRITIEGQGPNVRLSGPAILPVSEKKYPLKWGKDPTDSGFVGELTESQPSTDPQLTTGEQIASFKAMQKHSAYISENIFGKNVDSFESGFSQQLTKHLDNPSVVSSLDDRPKDGNVMLTSSEVLHQTVSYSSNQIQPSLFSVESKPDLQGAPGNVSTVLPDNKEGKLATNDDQENPLSPLSLGIQGSDSKENGISTRVEAPGLSSTYENHLISSKILTHSAETKKRKKQLPLLIPWHVAAGQLKVELPTSRYAEELWAFASNRPPEKDVMSTSSESTVGISRAKRRLMLTTESMQRLFSPPLDGLMHDKTLANKECGVYYLAKMALKDACGLVAQRNAQATVSPAGINLFSPGQAYADSNTLVESFMERVKHSGMELARLDCSTSVAELQGETHELEKLSIVNRLAKHHGLGFIMDSSDNLFIENIFGSGLSARRAPPQRYVTAAPMPRTLPEGVRCLSL